MIRTSSLLTLLFALSIDVSAQVPPDSSPYTWINPIPLGVELYAVDQFADGRVMIAGDRGKFAISDDDGETWSPHATGFARVLRGLGVVGNFGILCGDGGAVHRTTDAGRTWVWDWAPTDSRNLRDVAVLSPERYIAVGGNLSNRGVIVATHDGGESWTVTDSDVSVNFHSVTFPDSLNGWACGPPDVLFRTTDGGLTWERDENEIFRGQLLRSVRFTTADRGFVGGGNEFLCFTEDGGKTWVPVDYGEPFGNVQSGCWIDDTTAFVSASRLAGIIYNGGRVDHLTWRGAPNAQDVLIDPDRGLGFAVRGTPEILRSTDRGRQWSHVSSGVVGGTVGDIDFLDEARGVLGRTDGVIMLTVDSGRTWEFGRVNTGFSRDEIRAVAYPAPDVIVLVRFEGSIQTSRNGGENFLRELVSDDKFYEVSFSDRNNGWVSGTSTVLRTTDGGWTWQEDETSFSVPVYAIHAVDSLTAYAAGYDGMIARTVDAGATWQMIETEFTVDFFMVCADTAGRITLGWRGGLVHSDDGGVTWSDHRAPEGSGLLGFSFIDPMTGWCGQLGRPILSTSDAGATWRSYEHELINGLTAVDLIKPGYGHGGGAYTNLLRLEEPDSVTSVPFETERLAISRHEAVVVPNPASGLVRLSFPDGRPISSAEIVDAAGRIVGRLQPEGGPAAVLTLDIGSLPIAPYRVRIRDRSGETAESMVVRGE